MPDRVWLFNRTQAPEPHEILDPNAAVLVLRPQATLRGRVVVPEGVTPTRARLELVLLNHERTYQVARTRPDVAVDAEGRFEVRVDAPSVWELRATLGDARSDKLYEPLRPGEVREVELSLVRPYRITGRVLDGFGRPQASALVRLDEFTGNERLEHTMTDAEGRFELRLCHPGSGQVVSTCRGLVQAALVVCAVDDETPHAEVEIPMTPEASLRGRLVWDDGKPVQAGTLAVQPDGSLDPDDPQRRGEIRAQNVTHLQMEEDGSFRVDALTPGVTYHVTASVWDKPWTYRWYQDVPAGAEDLELVLERAWDGTRTLYARVVDAATGAPVRHFEVGFGYMGRQLSAPQRFRFHDDQGRFEQDCQYGRFTGLEVNAVGYAPRRVGPLPLDEDLGGLVIALERFGALEVVVRDADGAPVADATLGYAEALSAESPDLFPEGRVVTTDGDGRWVLDPAPPGRVLLQAAQGTRVSDIVLVDVPGGGRARAELTLAGELPGARLTVSVFHADGRPAVDLPVRVGLAAEPVLGAPAEPVEQHTDQAGRAVFAGLRPGHYEVVARPARPFRPLRTLPLRAGDDVALEFRRSSR